MIQLSKKIWLAMSLSTLVIGCENNTPEETEKFVEKSAKVETKSAEGTTGDVGNSALTFLPSFKDFGDIAIGEKSPEQVITVFNSSDYPIFLGKIFSTNEISYNISKTDCPFEKPTSIASGVSCRVYIQFKPVVGGVARAKIKLTYGLSVETNTQFGSGSDVTGAGISNLLFAGVGSITNIKGNSVLVNWTHIVGATSYFVYTIDDEGVATLKGTVAAPINSFAVTGLTKNTEYIFRVKAVDSQGIADGNTNDVKATTLAENEPLIAAVNPSAGPLAGGQTITITGSDFVNGATVSIGGVTCGSVSFNSSAQLTCVTAAASAGVYDANVTNPDAQTGTLTGGYSYQAAPTISSITPNRGSWEGSTSITIAGTGFVTGATVTIDGVNCMAATVVNQTSITCVTPPRGSGATGGIAVDVVVANTDAQQGTAVGGFTYEMQRIDLIAGAIDPRGCRASADPSDVRFDAPHGMTTDGTHIYVAPYLSQAIYKINIATRETTLFAGQPCIAGNVNGAASAALLNQPVAMQILGGYLYFSNYATNQIRRVDLATREVSFVAGAGVAGNTDGIGAVARFNAPWSMTTDGTHLYVSDLGTHLIRKIDVSTNEVTTFAGSVAGNTDAVGAAARFNQPRELTYAAGYIYVADRANHRIRRIDVATQTVTTFAGAAPTNQAGHAQGVGTAARFNVPVGISTDGTSLFVADFQVLREINIATASVSVLSGVYNTAAIVDGPIATARTHNPRNMLSVGGYVYFTDDSHGIRRVDPATGEMTTWVGVAQGLYFAAGVNDTGSAARFNAMRASIYHDGYLYVADYNNHAVRRVDTATGAVSTFSGLLGNLGWADGFAGGARHNGPAGLAIFGDYLYVSDYAGHVIRRTHIPTQYTDTIAGTYGVFGNTDDPLGTNATFRNPYGLAVDATGTYLYVADALNHRIRRIDLATTEVTTLAGSTAGTVDGTGVAAQFNQPGNILLIGSTLYVVSTGAHRLRTVDVNTTVVTSLSSGTIGYQDDTTTWNARFYAPKQMATDGTYLYMTDNANHAIRKVHLTTFEVSTVTANLQPDTQAAGYKAMWCKTGLLTEEAAISNPWGIAYDASIGLIVNNDYGVFRVY